MTVIDKVKEALKVYNAEDVQCTVYEEYNGFEVYCNIQDKHIHIEAVERLALTGIYEVSIGSITYYDIQEGKTREVHAYIYNCAIRSILRTVTVTLENLLQ